MNRSVTGALLVGAVLVVATLVAATVLTDDTAQSPPDPDGVAEQYRSLDGFRATQVQTVRFGNNTTRTVRRVAVRPGTGQFRSVAVRGANRSVVYDLIVSNGSVRWLYDRENRRVQRTDVTEAGNGGTPFVTNGTRLEGLVTAAVNDTEERSAVSRLPTVSPLGRPQIGASDNLSTLRGTAEYVGTDTVDGRQTYVLSVSLNQSAVQNASTRVWLDTEWFVMLQRRGSFTVDGTRVETSVRYRNVSFEPGLNEESFQFDPPDNVTIDTGPEIRSYDSRAALSRNTTLSVPDPDVPDGFSLEEASLTVTTVTAATLRYANATASLTVTVTNESGSFEGDGQPVTVGNRTGRLDSFGETRIVNWNCSDRSVLVAGPVSNATLLRFAESIGCGQSRPETVRTVESSPPAGLASAHDVSPHDTRRQQTPSVGVHSTGASPSPFRESGRSHTRHGWSTTISR